MARRTSESPRGHGAGWEDTLSKGEDMDRNQEGETLGTRPRSAGKVSWDSPLASSWPL